MLGSNVEPHERPEGQELSVGKGVAQDDTLMGGLSPTEMSSGRNT